MYYLQHEVQFYTLNPQKLEEFVAFMKILTDLANFSLTLISIIWLRQQVPLHLPLSEVALLRF